MPKLTPAFHLSLLLALFLSVLSISSAASQPADLDYREILKKITTDAMAEYDSVRYVRAGLDALASTYQLDVREAMEALNDDNAGNVFTASMMLALTGNPGVPADQVQQTAFDAMLKLVDSRSRFINVKEFEAMRGQSGKRAELTKVERDFQLDQLENQIVYIHIKRLGYMLSRQLRNDLEKIENLASQALIIDLRGNTGGLLDSAIEFSDMFLGGGPLLKVEHRQSVNDLQYNTRKGDKLEYATPVAVLVDGVTASGSELIARALRTRKNSRIFGSQTFGIAGIRSIYPLENSTALMMTTARMVFADGTSWHDQGIQPDVCVDYKQNMIIKDKSCQRTEYKVGKPGNDLALQKAVEFVSLQRNGH